MEHVSELRLIELLEYTEAQDSTLYLMLDVATQDNFWQHWQSRLLAQAPEWQYLYHQTSFDHLKSVSPILIRVTDGNVGNDILQFLPDTNWGCLFVSPFSLDALLKHWQCWMTIYLPNGQESLFRLYSPRILQLFLQTEFVDDADRGRLTDPFLQMLTVTNTPLVYDVLFCQPEARPSPLSQGEWFYMEDDLFTAIEALYHDQTLADLAIELFHETPGTCMSLGYDDVILGLDDSLKKAAYYPRASFQERKIFAFSRFIYGSHFWQLPQFQIVLETSSLGQALYELNQRPDWQQIVQQDYHDADWLRQLSQEHI
ncbi:DUF4123 domain-containing protein [Vibrio gazogenes]|uniref:DUF4123 domain-containing protein n=1 Tax=Vibrio gazogenes DSM 21264 = NBRC 103151 TaxID=1123492 RepID=A0A1M5A4W0_VIBGA|nr:DUF4123 domain-containing protein [Vibrio gazogenes]USP13362.1 DUF4123 domain-containing protein [Vibrio gazogenes]SHF24996.1 protein of unknown function [Vibrio gazogenes DSM 21264] [Vibrio gazogenes DSM 21264 = NBRC 103151]SJN57018.1 hypothetical protein BQ6471_02336 [Vibrio gazogenes]